MSASAKISDNWRIVVARIFSRDLSDVLKNIVRFKIGEGGFTGSPKVPITPDETFTDLQSEGADLTNGGICEFTNGSAIVTGSGTNFVADVSAGEWIKPGPEPHPTSSYSAGDPGTEEDVWGQVQSVDSPTQITLTGVYGGTTHLLAEARPTRKASEPLYTFRKTLAAGDVLWDTPNDNYVEVTCLVDTSEANADQLSNSPEFFELGGFDEDGVMVFYHTFDEETKIASVQLVHIIKIIA